MAGTLYHAAFLSNRKDVLDPSRDHFQAATYLVVPGLSGLPAQVIPREVLTPGFGLFVWEYWNFAFEKYGALYFTAKAISATRW
jgi:hypothetical protein